MQTSDIIVRTALARKLTATFVGEPDTAILSEFAVHGGRARIDVAVVNGALYGYEVKSDKDSLIRLPEQSSAFGDVFDYLTLVVGEKHLRRAAEMVPDWWGIRAARGDGDRVEFCDLKLPQCNPTQDVRAIAALLWRSEALEVLRTAGPDVSHSRMRCSQMIDVIVDRLPLSDVTMHVRECLKRRALCGVGARRLSCGG